VEAFTIQSTGIGMRIVAHALDFTALQKIPPWLFYGLMYKKGMLKTSV